MKTMLLTQPNSLKRSMEVLQCQILKLNDKGKGKRQEEKKGQEEKKDHSAAKFKDFVIKEQF